MYSFSIDHSSGLVDITLAGFWVPADVGAFQAAMADQIAALRAAGRTPCLLYDYTRAAIQSQEVVALFQEMARTNPFGSNRTAVFTDGVLARRQAYRVVAEGGHMRLFEDRAAAIAWLLAGQAAAATPRSAAA